MGLGGRKFLGRKWLIVNEEETYKKINCINDAELRTVGNTCIRLDLDERIKLGIYNLNWEGGIEMS